MINICTGSKQLHVVMLFIGEKIVSMMFSYLFLFQVEKVFSMSILFCFPSLFAVPTFSAILYNQQY